jgi:phosphate transport system permease protein
MAQDKQTGVNIFNLNRRLKDKLSHGWMMAAFLIVFLMPFLLAAGLVIKSSGILTDHSIWKLIFSKKWAPLSGDFGLASFLVSSLWVTILAVFIAAPICILSAIHLTQYARKWFLRAMHPVIDILAGLPSVIYGVWGIIIVVPWVKKMALLFDISVSGYSILAGSIVLAIMIIPFILNILIEVFRTIPEELTEASLSLGATHWQTIKRVLLRKASPGIASAVGLGVSRAFGETIAVLMVVGNVVQIPKGIFQPGYPLPALIANNYGEMMSIPKYDAALMLSALLLFVVVLLFNFASRIAIIQFENRI